MKRVNIFKNLQLGENMVYSLVWTAIFLIPFMNAHLMSENEINFGNVIISWGKILPYFSIFLVNNYLLAPLLLLRNRYILYSITLFILVLTPFGAIEYLDFHYYQANIDLRHKASLTELAWYWNVLFGILMASANSMIKLYYRAIITNQRMLDLERQNMEAQMQYLKYQINPHFLMNTLNNIYALIDFDRDLAKCSVMDLSRMMRHVLYDASESETTLDKVTFRLSCDTFNKNNLKNKILCNLRKFFKDKNDKIIGFNELGLVFINRKRVKNSVDDIMLDDELIKVDKSQLLKPIYLMSEIYKKIVYHCNYDKIDNFILYVSNHLNKFFTENDSSMLKELERVCHKNIVLKTVDSFTNNKYEVIAG